jgi:flagellar biogenesis protein FliO
MEVILQDDIMPGKAETKVDLHANHMIIYNTFDAVSLGLILGFILCILMIVYLLRKLDKRRKMMQSVKLQEKDK